MHDVDRVSDAVDSRSQLVVGTHSPYPCLPCDLVYGAGSTRGPVRLAAELLVRSASPGIGARLVDEHGPDASGHCRGCPHAVTSGPVFPCRLRLIGEAAVRLIGEAAVELDTRVIGAVA